MALLRAFLQLMIHLNSFFKRMLRNLLSFLVLLNELASKFYKALRDFFEKFLRLFFSLLWTLLKLSLFYLPGLALVIFLWDNLLFRIAGIVYMAGITCVGIFYRKSDETDKPAKIGFTWLTYFPIDWSYDTDFSNLLEMVTNFYDDLKVSIKHSDNEIGQNTLKRILTKLDTNIRWTRQHIKKARKLKKMKRKFKDNKMKENIDRRIENLKERIKQNLDQFNRVKTKLGDMDQALDDQAKLLNELTPLEDEIIYMEEFTKALKKE